MARRRRKQSGFEQLVSAPWQLSAVVGVVAFVGIRYGIGWYFTGLNNPYLSALGASSSSDVFEMLAWVALGTCWVAAAASFLNKPRATDSAVRIEPTLRRASAEAGEAETAPPPHDVTESTWEGWRAPLDHPESSDPAPVTHKNIDNLSWLQFEHLIAASFRNKGFATELTAEGADEGVDIVLRERDNVLLVQCKHWGSYRVGVKIVRELFGVLHAKAAREAILVTSGQLTRDARNFCKDNAIGCFDRGTLLAFVDPKAMPPQHEINEDRSRLCPLCSSPLKLRTARNTGKQFYGCSRYPRCKGIRAARMSGG